MVKKKKIEKKPSKIKRKIETGKKYKARKATKAKRNGEDPGPHKK